jgi:hypothetical protein
MATNVRGGIAEKDSSTVPLRNTCLRQANGRRAVGAGTDAGGGKRRRS